MDSRSQVEYDKTKQSEVVNCSFGGAMKGERRPCRLRTSSVTRPEVQSGLPIFAACQAANSLAREPKSNKAREVTPISPMLAHCPLLLKQLDWRDARVKEVKP
jgi:hypothetical protein